MSGDEEERPYDVVVFGSTGYTGKFVVEEVYRVQCEERRSLRWAAAGRNEEKVRACLEASGPYQLYGEPVIKACIKNKCDYVDITGEPYFMEKMQQVYSEQAQEAGVLLVSSCGFDSIPNDLGALYLQRTFQGELAYVDSYVSTTGSGFHIGTWESFIRSIQNHRKLQQLRQQKTEEKLPFSSSKPPKKGPLFFSSVMNKWALPFPGADKAVVYRSMRHRYQVEQTAPFKFRTFFGVRSVFQAVAIVLFLFLVLVLVCTPCGLTLLLKYPGVFSAGYASKSGPSKQSLESATFTFILEGYGYGSESTDRSQAPDSKMVIKIRGPEPGYVATSAMLVQSALCLVYERDALPAGGYLTPSVAFGNTNIIKNLQSTGKFRIETVET